MKLNSVVLPQRFPSARSHGPFHMAYDLQPGGYVTEDISLSRHNEQEKVHNAMLQFIQAKLSYPLNKQNGGISRYAELCQMRTDETGRLQKVTPECLRSLHAWLSVPIILIRLTVLPLHKVESIFFLRIVLFGASAKDEWSSTHRCERH
jgi:hypothetical protein